MNDLWISGFVKAPISLFLLAALAALFVTMSICLSAFNEFFFYGTLCCFSFTEGKIGKIGPCHKKCVKFSVIFFKKCLFSHFKISPMANLGKSNIFKKSSVAKQNAHSLIMFGSFDPNFFCKWKLRPISMWCKVIFGPNFSF